MINQLWYTWSNVGLGGVTGFRIRAASPGLADVRSGRVQRLDRYLRYKLPAATDVYSATSENSPRSLAFLSRDGERLLIHKAYVGKDDYGRPGVFMVHLLAGFSSVFTAADALALWDSRNWQSKRPDASVPVSLDVLDERDLTTRWEKKSFAKTDLGSLKQHLPAVIQHFLLLSLAQSSKKIYISAPSSTHVVRLLWGLAQSLPPTFQQQFDLTFSVYEADVNDSDARIVGTCGPSPDLIQKLSQSQVGERAVVLNCTPMDSVSLFDSSRGVVDAKQVEAVRSYAHFATQCLTEGRHDFLAGLLQLSEDSGFRNFHDFLVLCQQFEKIESNTLTRADVDEALQDPTIRHICLTHSNFQSAIVDYALADERWGLTRLQLLSDLCANEQARSGGILKSIKQLVEKIAEQVRKALNDSRPEKPVWDRAIRLLLPITAGQEYIHLHRTLLKYHAEYFAKNELLPVKICSWETHQALMSRWKSVLTSENQQYIRPWFQITSQGKVDWNVLKQFSSVSSYRDELKITIDDILEHVPFDWEVATNLISQHLPPELYSYEPLENAAKLLIAQQIDEDILYRLFKLSAPDGWLQLAVTTHLHRNPSWQSVQRLFVEWHIPASRFEEVLSYSSFQEQADWPVLFDLLDQKFPIAILHTTIEVLLDAGSVDWFTIKDALRHQVPVAWLQDSIEKLSQQYLPLWPLMFEMLDLSACAQWLQMLLIDLLEQEKMDWRILAKLLEKPVEEEIKRSAIEKMLIQCKEQEIPYAIYATHIVQNNAEDFEYVMLQLLASSRTRAATISFFVQLCKNKYGEKMQLLHRLLEKRTNLDEQEMAVLLKAAGLSPIRNAGMDDLRTFVRENFSVLMHYNLFSLVQVLLKRYITEQIPVYEDLLVEDRQIIKNLKDVEDPAFAEIRHAAKRLSHALKAVESAEMLRKLATSDRLITLAQVIRSLQWQNSERYKDQFFRRLTEISVGDYDLLKMIVETQAPIFTEGRLNDMLLLLASHLAQNNQTMLTLSAIQPYINLSINYNWNDSDPKNSSDVQLAALFDRLFLPLSQQMREKLDNEIAYSSKMPVQALNCYHRWHTEHPLTPKVAVSVGHSQQDRSPLPVARAKNTSEAGNGQEQGKDISGNTDLEIVLVMPTIEVILRAKDAYINTRLQKVDFEIQNIVDEKKKIYFEQEKNILQGLSRDRRYSLTDDRKISVIGDIIHWINSEAVYLQRNDNYNYIQRETQSLLKNPDFDTIYKKCVKRSERDDKELRYVTLMFRQLEKLFADYRKNGKLLPEYLVNASSDQARVSAEPSIAQKENPVKSIFKFIGKNNHIN